MNTLRIIFVFGLAVVLAAGALAQSRYNRGGSRSYSGTNGGSRNSYGYGSGTNGVPGATDYAAFSGFISERNIFDPNRRPRSGGQPPYTPPPPPRHHSSSAPAFTFVGTMNYEKGLFAFFSGNTAELKKVLPVSEKIAGYTVAAIEHGQVTLESTNKEDHIELKVGDVMREENGKWVLSGRDDGSGFTGASASSAGAGSSPAGGENPAAAPTSTAEPNEVLKRLMQQREKENQ